MMRAGTCACGRPYYDDDGPCHYKCTCGELISYDNATPDMINYGYCEECMTDFNDL